MAKSVFFKIRSKKKSRRKANAGKILIVFLAIALLGAAAVHYSREPVVPAMTGSPSQEGKPRMFFLREAAGLRILSQVIPGFGETGEPPPEETSDGDAGEKGEEKESRFTVLANTMDPKNILSAQIPYMGQTGEFLQPLVNPVSRHQESEEPRIIRPVENILSGSGDIIIYHTHTTESFVPTSGKRFTDDLHLTVAQLGEELAGLLNGYGIPVVTDNTIHDIPRSKSYEEALPTITKLLAENPEAKLVIDLHRDGVARSVTTAEINGKPAGKILFVVGSRHPHWKENNEKALFLHHQLEQLSPGISRGVRERPLVYNQHVHPGALLIEIGGHENSLDEARRTLPVLAEALNALYRSGL